MPEIYTLLIVDDSETNLMLLDAILKTHFQHRVLKARNGLEALELIKATDVDIVLSDINMPYMNGYELAREIKASLSTQHIPILFISGDTTDGEKREIQESWAVGCIEKPIKTTILKIQLEECFRMISMKSSNKISQVGKK